MPLLQLQGITVAFGGPPVLDAVDLVVEPGERLCLLGRNGAGKSTLLKVILGELAPDQGDVVRQAGLRVAFLAQQVPAGLSGTVLELATSGLGARPATAVQEHVARAAVSRVGLEPDLPVAALSAGLKRRALLACALAAEPDLLLLDEPTNHLDVEAIGWLEEFLRRQGRTLLFVTHDRAFLRRLATGILDLDRGRVTRYEADYDAYRERKLEALESEARADALFDKRLAQEEAWIRQGVRERRKRNMGRVARLQTMRRERSGRRDVAGTARIQAQAAPPSGRLVLQAKDVAFAWGGAPIVRGLTTTVLRGDRVGIIGPNGAGKTTLLRLLLGELAPDTGAIRQGANLQIGYFDQLHASLDEDATAADNVSEGGPTVQVGGRTRHVVGYLGEFLFTPDQARSPVRLFSGGERNRLLLARLFARPSNVLVLDEPTNDLDVETLEVLEALLDAYEGTVLLVSHDRELIDDVVTSVLVLEGEGRVGEYVGGYTDWQRQRREDQAARATPASRPAATEAPRRSAARLDRAQRKELNDLPARIEGLEARQASLHAAMADPAFFRRPGEEIQAAQADLRALEAEIAAAYARWEALEARRLEAD